MDCKMSLWLLLSVLFAAALAAKTFEGDQVISVIATSPSQFEFLKYLERTSELDFWSLPVRVGVAVDIHVTSEQLQNLEHSFMSHEIRYKVKIADIQRLLDTERDVMMSAHLTPHSTPDVLTKYGTQPEIDSWLTKIAGQCGDRCTLMPFGTSVEGREMTAIKIVASASSTVSKPAVFVDGGIHAREWISPAFVNNMINKLINDYNTDSDVRKMLGAYDWYILPLLNPDGYQYTHDSDRMWRKNRALTKLPRCRGVDLNRNFGYQWGVDGVSHNPCSEIYLGPSAFSEPESRALRDFLADLKNLQVYLTFHSYGQYILFPWGYDKVIAPNHRDMKKAGKAAALAIKKINDEEWTVGNSAIVFYAVGGAADDWAYGGANATYAYTIELPPKEEDPGFILPESEIPGVVKSVWPGVKAMMKRIIQQEQ